MNLKKIKRYSIIAFKKIFNHLQTSVFLKTGKWCPRPMRVYYLITNKCNYRCVMCPQWECGNQEQPAEYISAEKIKSIIDEMADIGIYEFGISGGEALVYPEKMFNLLEYANKKGLYTHFVTNGRLLTRAVIQKYNDIGGGHISLSLDAMGEKHDRLRGVPGAYEAVMEVLEIFKKNKFANIVLKMNTVISGANLEDVVAVVKLAIANNLVIFIQPYDVYDYAKKISASEKEVAYPLWVKKGQHELLKKVVAELLRLKKKYPQIILNEQKHLAAFYDYFTKCVVNQTCFAGIDQIAINPFGKVSFCKYGEYADLSQQSLKQFLNSKERQHIVKDSLQCKHGCLLSCMFRPSLGEMMINGPKQFVKLVKS